MAISRTDPLYTTGDPPPIGDIPDPMAISPGPAAPAPDVAPDQQAPGGWRTNVIPGNMASLGGTPISFTPDGTPQPTPTWQDNVAQLYADVTDKPPEEAKDELKLPTGNVLPFLSEEKGAEPAGLPNEIIDQMTSIGQQQKIDLGKDAVRQVYPSKALPQIRPSPETPENMLRHAIGAFTNPLMLMALVGGAMTKQGARGALAAATGVLQGLNERDWQKAYLQQHKFRNSVKETAAAEESELADIRAVMNSGKPMAEQQELYDVIARQHNDPTLSEMARHNFGQLQQLVDGRQKALDGLHKSTRGLGKTQERVAEENEAIKAGKPPGMSKADWSRLLRERQEKEEKIGPGTRGTTPPERQLTDASIKQVGDELVKGNDEPARRLIPIGKAGASDRAAVANYISDNYPDADLGKAMQVFRAQGAGLTAAERARTAAEPRADAASLQRLQIQQDQISQFEQTGLGNLRKLIELAKVRGGSGIPAIDRWVFAGRQATGDPDVAAFNTQYVVTIPEVARILAGNPTLAGQLTDTARVEVRSGLPQFSNLGQMVASEKVLIGDFERRKSNLAAQIAVVKKRINPSSFPEPDETDREAVRNDPTLRNGFMKHFGVEP